MINKYLQFIKFSFVGLLNTIFSFGIYTLLTFLGLYYLAASAIGYLSGILIGYMLTAAFVFKKEKSKSSAAKYFFVYAASLFINLLLMYTWVDLLSINRYLAQCLTIAVTMTFNYIFSKRWAFGGTG